jgi:hypothetical protein
MHILVGALMGAVCGAIGAVVVAYVTRKPVTWKGVLAGALGGLVGGAITAATLGAGGVAAATAARTATAYFAGGAGGGGVSKVYDNYLSQEPLMEGVPAATAIGGASGLASYGGATVMEPLLRKTMPAAANLWFGAAPETRGPPAAGGVISRLDEVSGPAEVNDPTDVSGGAR